MEYRKLIDEVQGLDFIRDSDTADAAVKSVLGILASRLPEAQARIMAERLPEPLNLEHYAGCSRMRSTSPSICF